MVATELCTGHPLALGRPAPSPVLVRRSRPQQATGEPQVDVLTVTADAPVLAGHVRSESVPRLAGSLLVASEELGSVTVITFAQDSVHRRLTLPELAARLGGGGAARAHHEGGKQVRARVQQTSGGTDGRQGSLRSQY